jgi:hypothetical protein
MNYIIWADDFLNPANMKVSDIDEGVLKIIITDLAADIKKLLGS